MPSFSIIPSGKKISSFFLCLLCFLSAARVVDAEIIDLTTEEFFGMATTGQIDLMIDVRTEWEWNTGHIENATFIDSLQTQLGGSTASDTQQAALQTALEALNLWNCRNCRVLVYCRSGSRAGAALALLEQAGFEGPLYNGQGVSQWTSAGYSLVNDPSKDDYPCMSAGGSSTAISRQSAFCKAPLAPVDQTDEETPEDGDSQAPDADADANADSSVYQVDQVELDAARDLFMAQLADHNATSYSFMFTLNCFCPPADYPWLVTAEMQELMMGIKDPDMTLTTTGVAIEDSVGVVDDDIVVSAITTAGNDVLQMNGTSLRAFSILDLFDKIQEAINKEAAQIEVVYNPEWGYPEIISVDYSTQMSDEEFYTTVENFAIVATKEDQEDDIQPDGEQDDSNTNSSSPIPVPMVIPSSWTPQMAMDEALSRWNAMAPSDYYFQYDWSAGMTMDYPLSVHVQDGTVVEAKDANGADIMVMPGAGRTISDFFSVVQSALSNAAATVDVQYDDTYGYPLSISIVYGSMYEEISASVSYFSTEGPP